MLFCTGYFPSAPERCQFVTCSAIHNKGKKQENKADWASPCYEFSLWLLWRCFHYLISRCWSLSFPKGESPSRYCYWDWRRYQYEGWTFGSLGPIENFPNDENSTGQNLWWFTNYHKLGQRSQYSHPTRPISLVSGNKKAYYKLSGSYILPHLSWTQPEGGQLIKNSSLISSWLWMFFGIFWWKIS